MYILVLPTLVMQNNKIMLAFNLLWNIMSFIRAKCVKWPLIIDFEEVI